MFDDVLDRQKDRNERLYRLSFWGCPIGFLKRV